MHLVRMAGIGASLALLIFVGMAAAHVVKYPTGQLSIGYTASEEPAYFSGKVSATKPACQANRRVVVLSDAPGVDVQVGSTHTNDSGEWRIVAGNIVSSKYYADADRKTLKLTVDHRHVCRAVRSSSIQAGP